MSEPQAADPDPSSLVGAHYGVALEGLRSTVKWLVASAGAVVAAIIAGAQLVDYANRTWLGAGLAGIAVVVALSLAIALLVRAAKILTVPRSSVTELANAEMREGPKAEVTGTFKDPKVEWLLARKTYLLGSYDTVRELLSAYDASISAAHERPYDANEARRLTTLHRRIDVVEEAAHYRDASNVYDELLKQFRRGAIVFIAAVVVFSVSGLFRSSPQLQPTNPITGPISVHVQFTDAPASTPSSCRDRAGVAVDGTLTRPTVVMPSTPACPAQIVSPNTQNIVVIPDLPARRP